MKRVHPLKKQGSDRSKRGRKLMMADTAGAVRQDGMFRGVHVVLIPGGGVVQKQLQIWCHKVTLLGGSCQTLVPTSNFEVVDSATHIIATDTARLEKRMETVELREKAANTAAVSFKWLEECLQSGGLVPIENFLLRELGWYRNDREPSGWKRATAAGSEPCKAPTLDTAVGGVASASVQKLPLPGGGSLPVESACVPAKSEATHQGPVSTGSPGNPSTCDPFSSDGSDNEAKPYARNSFRSILQNGSSRVERVQEWMRTEVSLRRKGRPQDELGETQPVPSMGSQDTGTGEGAGPEASGGAELDVPLDLNEHITRHLTELQNAYEALGDQWRTLTYQRAVATLERVPFRLQSAEQLAGLGGVGPQVAEKVKEILGTGTLAKLDSFKKDAKLQVLRLFSSVFGIGPKTALDLYARGHRSLDDLRGDPTLTRQARLGLQYYEDIGVKMRREDVARIEDLVKQEAQAVCPGVWCEVTGSYRRGKAMCGDVDFLVTHPDGKSHRGLLLRLHQRLAAIGFLTADLRSLEDASDGMEGHCQTYMGMCRLPGTTTHRRIDIKVYPASVYATALVHFTGNDVFNRKVRYFALQLGFKLSEYGLFPVTKIGKRKFVEKACISCATEKDVFANLGLEYLEPHERNW